MEISVLNLFSKFPLEASIEADRLDINPWISTLDFACWNQEAESHVAAATKNRFIRFQPSDSQQLAVIETKGLEAIEFNTKGFNGFMPAREIPR